MNYEPLNRELARVTAPYNTYASTYREIREQYMERGGSWKKDLARDTGLSTRQIDRYEKFVKGEPGQARNPDNVRGATKERFIEVGKTLEPLQKSAPPDGLTLTVTFKAPGDKGHQPREREFTVSMDYTTATQFVQSPDYDFLFDEWFEGGADTYGEDGDYEGEVTGVVAA